MPLSSDEILAGIGLVIVLALGCELLAVRTRLPAILLLLPAGFIAGAATRDVHPDALLGPTFQPIVAIGVGLILFEAGLRLRFGEMAGSARQVVVRLIALGVVITVVGVTLTVKLVFGISWGAAVVLGAVLVVSGPTVVLPLLAFVRPSDRVRSVLKWEGVLIDPLGALLGVIAFVAVQNGAGGQRPFQPGALLLSLATGLAVGALGAALLWLLLRGIQRAAPSQSVAASLLVVVGAVVAADLLREDAGFVAATTMGIVLANRRELDVSKVLEFQAVVVRLLIGVLFVLISASVAPSTINGVLAGGIGLVAVMVCVLRPLVVWLGTRRSDLEREERIFMGWLAPRGIVAAATASAFGPQLARSGVGGAGKILPIAFIAIFGTVVVYGLTAAPLARRLHLTGTGGDVVLVVGGHAWARAIARALEAAGVRVRLWTGSEAEQAAARGAGLTAGQAHLGPDVAAREAALEEITDALLLTESDDFNALAAYELGRELGSDHVFALPPRGEPLDPGAEELGRHVLFGHELTYPELSRRFAGGAELMAAPFGNGADRQGGRPLFVVSAGGRLHVATAGSRPPDGGGQTAIYLAGGEAGEERA